MNTMLRYSLLCIVIAFLINLTGCPSQREHNFISANPDAGRLFDGPVAGMEGDTENEGENEDRDVIEPDVIRQDGHILYILNQYRGLSIIDLRGPSLLAQVPTYGYPRDLYVVDDRAYVLVGYAADIRSLDNRIEMHIASRLYILDISTPYQASIIGEHTLPGDFLDSRLVGDVLYAVSTEYTWGWEDGVVSNVNKQAQGASWVSSVYLGEPENIEVIDTLSFEGMGNIIQASHYALFVASSDWQRNTSRITYVDIDDPTGVIVTRGTVEVPGYIADRFKMDAWNGVLRVASNTWWPERDVYVTTVDLSDPDSLNILGSLWLENAAGETLFATRFDGPRGYLVTYLMVDPLFVIDLSDPADPYVLGELKAPGWSTHIEPRGNTLIALGVDDTNQSWRASVSLFDVGDPTTPTLKDRESFGENWSWSSAHQDVKAFTVLDDTIIVPFSGWWEGNAGSYQRLQFLNYTEHGLTLRGYLDLQGQILRTFKYNDLYYCVTSEQLAVIDASDMSTPVLLDNLTLAAYVQDFIPFATGGGVEVIAEHERNQLRVRSLDANEQLIGEIEFDFPVPDEIFLKDDILLLVATSWYPDYQYRIARLAVSSFAPPQILEDSAIEVQPFWGGSYPIYMDIEPAMGFRDWYYPWWGSGDRACLVDDMLVLRCTSESYDNVLGVLRPEQGLALVPIHDVNSYTTLGLGINGIEQVYQKENHLYLGIKENAGFDLRGRALCAYYVRTLDIESPSVGPAANVPGRIVSYSPDSNRLILEDVQYTGMWDIAKELHSVRWTGNSRVELLDSKALPKHAGNLKEGGQNLFYDYYDQSGHWSIGHVRIDNSGQFGDLSSLQPTANWGHVLGVQESVAYIVLGSQVIARYDFKTEPPQLIDYAQSMGSPIGIRFGDTAAHVPLGYAGLLVMPFE